MIENNNRESEKNDFRDTLYTPTHFGAQNSCAEQTRAASSRRADLNNKIGSSFANHQVFYRVHYCEKPLTRERCLTSRGNQPGKRRTRSAGDKFDESDTDEQAQH